MVADEASLEIAGALDPMALDIDVLDGDTEDTRLLDDDDMGTEELEDKEELAGTELLAEVLVLIALLELAIATLLS